MIELGGNIKLEGFNTADPSTLIVVKKIVGNFAKKIQEQTGEFQELSLHLTDNMTNNYTLHAKLKGTKECNAEASEVNLFFAINKALEDVMKQALQ
jgi:ribosome-associated translation inhibitor RaiA